MERDTRDVRDDDRAEDEAGDDLDQQDKTVADSFPASDPPSGP